MDKPSGLTFIKATIAAFLLVPNALAGQPVISSPVIELPPPTTSTWTCVPPDFTRGPKRDLAIAGKESRRVDWVRPAITLETLSAGLSMSKGDVLVWKNLHRFPTICTEAVPEDWTGFQSIGIEIISEVATGDRLTIGVLADNPATGHQDYFCNDFIMDWKGTKTVMLSLSSFEKIGKPLNWQGIKGLYIFSKAKSNSPDPQTALSLVSIKLHTQSTPQLSVAEAKDEIEYWPWLATVWDAPRALNRLGPEILTPMEPGKPIVQGYFLRNSRALYGYHPKYNPGYVSVDPGGTPYIRTADRIQWLDAKGVWHEKSLLEPIREFARTKKWTHFGILNKDADPTIRFDRSGTLYLIAQVEANGNWSAQIPLLLYTSDLNAPWKWLALPGTFADFEKVDGGNQEAIERPPVLTLYSTSLRHYTQYPAPVNPDKLGDIYLVALEKQEDHTLGFSQPVAIGHGQAESLLTGPTHDGKGNLLISRKGKIIVLYGTYPAKSDPDPKKIWERPRDPAWWASLKIPESHPANSMMLDPVRLTRGEPMPCSGGVPVFARAFDRAAGKFEAPVFIGYGGRHLDGHNTPAMTVDSKGIFHVILMGHNDPALYSHTLKPDDISTWTPPTPINIAPDKNYGCRASYAALTCDRNDNLHFMFRSDSEVYNHRLDIISKDAGKETWNTARSVFVPLTDEYHAWLHSLCYDPVRDHLFLCFFEAWSERETQDIDFFHRFYFPFSGAVPKGSKSKDRLPHAYKPPSEGVVLISADSGKTWTHATTPDFLNNTGSSISKNPVQR
jgi:hypothetical protein